MPARTIGLSRGEPSPAALDELDSLARLLDTQWRIPGTSIRFGADAVAGLIPGIGDTASGLVSAYIVYRAWRMGASGGVLVGMVGNVLLDTLVGSIPLLGSVFDVFYKANIRNIRLLRGHMSRRLGL